ncbi:MAG: DNA polymerase III subunit beta [Tissierellia bacterium]|jgi:DNA polymerase-3 subunit beta|nr:DNA polymerase III subunit beta [Bacillota bacterium]NLK59029.1 DNA polymerase III subunit beta [Tissierellia bacterium]
MKLTIAQKELQKHIQIAQRAISPRNTVQILDGILFEAKDGMLHLSSTDLELGIRTEVPCEIGQEGKAVLSGNMIGNITRKLPQDLVYLETEGTQTEIRCKNSQFQLVGYQPEEYPELTPVTGEPLLSIPGKEWRTAIRQTLFATSQDDTKPVLRGVLFDMKEDGVHLVALDGFRIALRKMNLPTEHRGSYIIPGRTLSEINKITDDDQIVSLFADKGNMSFSFGDTIVNTRLLEGQFIQYETLLQADSSVVFETGKKDLYDALERASLLAGEDRANLIKLYLSDNACAITSNTEMGHVFENVEGKLEGEPLEIAFNARYLLEGVKEIAADTVTLSFSTPLKPLLIRPVSEEEDYTYLVLPVRLGQEAR